MKRRVLSSKSVALILLLLLGLNASCGGDGDDNSVSQTRPIYLQAVTSDSVYVMAESQSTDPLTVDYGPTTSYGNSAATVSTKATTGGTFIHRIALTGLTPDTIYYYRLGSHHNSFHTAVNSGTSFRFAWMADCRTGTDIHDKIAAMILAADPRFSLYGGDLCDNGSSYDIYKDQFFRPHQVALAAHVPFFNATGNHEKWKTNTKAFMQAPASASDNQGYYSFDYGDLHVVVMNFMDPGGYAAGSPQYNFVASDLAATTKAWKIVTCHSPAYASGGHGEDADMIALTTNVFEPFGVDLVVAGHDHFYQRNFMNNIYHVIIGSAGAPLVDPGPVEGYTQVSLKTYCWALFDLTPTSLQVHVYNKNGTEIDSLLFSK
ncbi:MAG: metallophosphoesterase family protein [Syntrophaceae bacterium]